jgi:hypothetical protein
MTMRLRILLFPLCLACAPWSAWAQANTPAPGAAGSAEGKRADMRIPQLDRASFEPQARAKRTVSVPANERNPFGLLSLPPAKEEQEVQIEVETEEMKIKRVLSNMRVGGLSGGDGSHRVLLGPMTLAKGDRLPQIFANQVEQLVVDDVSDGKISLRFIEGGGKHSAPRTFAVSFNRGLAITNNDGSPRVRALMAGDLYLSVVNFEGGAVAMDAIPTASAQGILDAFGNEQLHEALYGGRRKLLGEIWPIKKDESSSPEQEKE